MNLLAIEESTVGIDVTLLDATVWIDNNDLPVGIAFPISVKI
jgi:hypothetical protein